MLPALAICLFALAIIGRDGFWVIAGSGATLAAAAVPGGMIWTTLQAVWPIATYSHERGMNET